MAVYRSEHNPDLPRSKPDLVINVESARINADWLFPPAAGILPGTVDPQKMHEKTIRGAAIGVIPGYQLRIWTKGTPYGEIVDRLRFPEFKGTLERMSQSVMKDESHPVPGGISPDFKRTNAVPEGGYPLDGPPPHNLASWLFQIHNALAYHYIVLVEGKLPTIQEIRQMGDIWKCDPHELGITTKEDYHIEKRELVGAASGKGGAA